MVRIIIEKFPFKIKMLKNWTTPLRTSHHQQITIWYYLPEQRRDYNTLNCCFLIQKHQIIVHNLYIDSQVTIQKLTSQFIIWIINLKKLTWPTTCNPNSNSNILIYINKHTQHIYTWFFFCIHTQYFTH
jgi:hypothetical protein